MGHPLHNGVVVRAPMCHRAARMAYGSCAPRRCCSDTTSLRCDGIACASTSRCFPRLYARVRAHMRVVGSGRGCHAVLRNEGRGLTGALACSGGHTRARCSKRGLRVRRVGDSGGSVKPHSSVRVGVTVAGQGRRWANVARAAALMFEAARRAVRCARHLTREPLRTRGQSPCVRVRATPTR